MRRIKYYICLISLLAYSLIITGQNLKEDIFKQINMLNNNQISTFDELSLLKYNHKELLDSLKLYDADTSINVRFNIQLLEYRIALRNPLNSEIKREVVNRFILYLNDSVELIKQNAIEKLFTFSYKDFNKKSIEKINQIVKEKKYSNDIILLIGIADIQDQKDNLLALINKDPITKFSDFHTVNWYSHLSLARMGRIESIYYCITNVENYKDTIQRVTSLLNDIAYIRREPVIEYLKKYLNNESKLPSVKENIPGTCFCQYSLDLLAKIIEDFPIKEQGVGYTDEEIEMARKWMNSNKNYKIKR